MAILTSPGVASNGLQLREQARRTKSYGMIGYPSGQDGAILSTRDYPLCPARKIYPKVI